MDPDRVINRARTQMLNHVTVEERRLILDGVRTSVLEAGNGPPMVLLHGGIECGGVYWAPVISRLAETHHVVVPDVPGIGESDPLDRLDAASFTNWFTALLAIVGDQPTLVAHSLLGSLAARFATDHSDVLGRLVIYAGPGIGRYQPALGLQLAAVRFSLRPTERNAERFDRWGLHDLDAFRHRQPEWYDAFSAYCRSRSSVPDVKRTMRQLLAVGSKQIAGAELDRISCPTALVWGSYDRMVPLHLAQTASSRHGWPLHVIGGAGRVPHMEQPEAFVRVLAKIESGATATRRETS